MSCSGRERGMVNHDMTEQAIPVPFRPVQPPWTQFEALIDLPEATQGTIEVEGAAIEGDADTHSHLTVRLFPRGREMREVPLSEVPALARSEDNFVWVDLATYRAADLRRVAGVLGLPDA